MSRKLGIRTGYTDDWRDLYDQQKQLRRDAGMASGAEGVASAPVQPGELRLVMPTAQEILRWGNTVNRSIVNPGWPVATVTEAIPQLVYARINLPQRWTVTFVVRLFVNEPGTTFTSPIVRAAINVSLGGGRALLPYDVLIGNTTAQEWIGFTTLDVPAQELNIDASLEFDPGIAPPSGFSMAVSGFASPFILGR